MKLILLLVLAIALCGCVKVDDRPLEIQIIDAKDHCLKNGGKEFTYFSFTQSWSCTYGEKQ